MASEIVSARERSVDSINATGGSRQAPRLYGYPDTERYPVTVRLGISTRDETAQKDKSILDSVIGQMSDGMWENSRQMEKYWRGMTISQDNSGNVELRHSTSYDETKYGWGRNGSYSYRVSQRSGYNGMSGSEVRAFLAKKIKQIVDRERKDDASTGKWSATNQTELQYMNGGVTVADAYSLYKRLRGK